MRLMLFIKPESHGNADAVAAKVEEEIKANGNIYAEKKGDIAWVVMGGRLHLHNLQQKIASDCYYQQLSVKPTILHKGGSFFPAVPATSPYLRPRPASDNHPA